MSPVEWYYARDNVQMGPVSAIELKRLASVGELLPEHLVWREGMTDWSLARNVRGLFDEEEKPPIVATPQPSVAEVAPEVLPASPVAAVPVAPTAPMPTARPRQPTAHPLDGLLNNLRQSIGPRQLDAIGDLFRQLGSYVLWVAMLLVAVLAVLQAVKGGPVGHILTGLGAILVLVAIQYVAGKACVALLRRSEAVSGQLSSDIFPNSIAVLSGLASVASVLVAIAIQVQTHDHFGMGIGLAAAVLLAYQAVIALHPNVLGISTSADLSLAEEALGLVVFLTRLTVRSVPAVFGTGVILGTVVLGVAGYLAMRGADPLTVGILSQVGLAATIYAGLLPLVGFVAFLVIGLLIGLCRAILGRAPVDAAVPQPPASEPVPTDGNQ